MDQTLSRLFSSQPGDRSLVGLPVTAMVVVFISILLVSLGLKVAGRSWGIWHVPATVVFMAWFSGIYVGHYGLRSAGGTISTVFALVVVAPHGVNLFRSALRRNSVPSGRTRAEAG